MKPNTKTIPRPLLPLSAPVGVSGVTLPDSHEGVACVPAPSPLMAEVASYSYEGACDFLDDLSSNRIRALAAEANIAYPRHDFNLLIWQHARKVCAPSPVDSVGAQGSTVWERAEIAAGALCKALDAIKAELARDEKIRNHPERRAWEQAITDCVPSLPSILKAIRSVERSTARAALALPSE